MLKTFLLLAVSMLVQSVATAQYHAPMAHDRSFGESGFAQAPVLPFSPLLRPLGFVHLPLSGGYLFFSLQGDDRTGFPITAATRFTDSGTIDTTWMSGGSATYTPVFDSNNVNFIVVDSIGSPATERIYVVGRALLAKDNPLTVITLDASGALLTKSSSDLASVFIEGIGQILGVAPAYLDSTSSKRGLVVAIQGTGSESSKIALVKVPASTGAIDEDHAFAFSRSKLGLYYFSPRDDGEVDLLGYEGTHALYARFNSRQTSAVNPLEVESLFDFDSCPDGAIAGSAATGMVRPVSIAPDVLVAGMMNCPSGTTTAVARVTSIDSIPIAQPNSIVEFGDCEFDGSLCVNSFIGVANSGRNETVIAVPDGLAYLSPTVVSDNVYGYDTFVSEPSTSFTSSAFGADVEYPYLATFGVSPDGTKFGISRLAIDRIFADGLGQ